MKPEAKAKKPVSGLLKSGVVAAGLVGAGAANAAATLPTEVTTVFTDLGTQTGLLMAAAAVLFGLIRGGTGVLKIASKFFGAAGA